MANFMTPRAGLITFPTLFKAAPRSEGSEVLAFSLSLIFDKKAQATPEFKAIFEEVEKLRKELAAEKKIPITKVRSPFADCAEKAQRYAGYDVEGGLYISPWTKNKPGVVDANRQPITDPNDVFAGQLGRANVSPFKWSNSGNNGVSFGLNGVQILVANMPRLDGHVSAEVLFNDGVGEEYAAGNDAEIPF